MHFVSLFLFHGVSLCENMVIPDSIRQELHGISGTSLNVYNKVLSICTHDQGVAAILTTKAQASYAVAAWPQNIRDRLTNNPGVQAFVGTAAVMNACKVSGNLKMSLKA